MNEQHATDSERLRRLAEQQYASISDAEVFGCWHVVVEAIGQRWLTLESLDELIHTLQTGGGLGVQEYGMEVIGGERVEVAFIDERYTCPRDAMVYELGCLRARSRGESMDEPAGPSAADITDATALLRSLAGLAATAQDTPAGRQARVEASAVIAAWADRPGGAPPAEDLRHAAEGLGPAERAQLADALRVFADWSQQPDPTTGARVDAVIDRLERSLGPLLEHGRRLEQAATDARIAADARDSVARRLRDAGAGGGAAGS
jgi:hypothetical protein